MENIDPKSKRMSLDSQSTECLPVLQSTCSLIDENSHRNAKAFSPGNNRMAPLLGKRLFMFYDPGTQRDTHVELVLKKLKAELVDFFSRDVNYVITNRPSNRLPPVNVLQTDDVAKDSTLNSTSTKHNETSRDANGLRTPLLASNKPVGSSVTRGRAMLLAARKATTTGSPLSSSSVATAASSVLKQIQGTNNDPSGFISSTTNPKLSGSYNQSCSTDLLSKARQLGIKILSLDTVSKWIKNLPSDVQSYIQSVQRMDSEDQLAELAIDPERDRINEVRYLLAPCIKVIDIEGESRPLYLDHTDYLPELWNLVNRHKPKPLGLEKQDGASTAVSTATAFSGSIPMASLGFGFTPASHQVPGTGTQSILTRRDSRTKRKQRLQKHLTNSTQSRRAAHATTKATENPTKMAVDEEPSGYCECCSTGFKNLLEHLHCPDHEQFANNSENYSLLDKVLNQLPSIEQVFEFASSDVSKGTKSSLVSLNRIKRKRHYSAGKSFKSGILDDLPKTSTSSSPISVNSTTVNINKNIDLSVTTSTTEKINEPLNEINSNVPPVLKLSQPADLLDSQQNRPVDLFSDDDGDSNKNNILPIDIDPIIYQSLDGEKIIHLNSEDIVQENQTSQIFDNYYNERVHQNLNNLMIIEEKREQESPKNLNQGIHESLLCAEETECLPRIPVGSNISFDPNTSSSEMWQIICEKIYISNCTNNCHLNEHTLNGNSNDSDTSSTSPLLKVYHRKCYVCNRVHIPINLPLKLQFQIQSLLGPKFNLDGLGCDFKEIKYHISELESNVSTESQYNENFYASNESEINNTQTNEVQNTITNNQTLPISQQIIQNSPVFETNDFIYQNENNSAGLMNLDSDKSSDCTSPMRIIDTANSFNKNLQKSDAAFECTTNSRCSISSLSDILYSPSGLNSDECEYEQFLLKSMNTPIYEATYSPVTNEPISCSSADDPLLRAYHLGQLPFLKKDEVSTVLSVHSMTSMDDHHVKSSLTNNHTKSFISEKSVPVDFQEVECSRLFEKPLVQLNNVNTTVITPEEFPKATKCRLKKCPKRLFTPTTDCDTSPGRNTGKRLAAKIARESISLSVKALFSPSGLDRDFRQKSKFVNPTLSSSLKSHALNASFVENPNNTPQNEVGTESTHSSCSPWDLAPGSTDSRLILRRRSRLDSPFLFTPTRSTHKRSCKSPVDSPQRQPPKSHRRSLFHNCPSSSNIGSVDKNEEKELNELAPCLKLNQCN